MKSEKRNWAESYLNLVQAKKNWGDAMHGKVDGKFVKWLGSQSEPTPQPANLRGAANSPLILMLEKNHYEVMMTQEEMDKISAWIDLYVPYSGRYPEAGDWGAQEKKKYAHFQAKRDYMREFDRINRQAKIRSMGGTKVVPENRESEYFPFTHKHAPESVEKFNARLDNYQAELNNDYRNVALNPDDHREPYHFPHATSQSEYHDETRFLAKNAIDGDKRNRKHGTHLSWGPDRSDKVPQPWLKIDFGREVVVDQVRLTLRADFPHDTTWRRARLEFSDGHIIMIDLKNSADEQRVAFKNRTIRWVRFTGLDPIDSNGWPALSEMEVWGRSVEP